MIWLGARALNTNPWDPVIRKLSLPQLHWAFLQANPQKRSQREMIDRNAEGEKAATFLSWFDKHVS